jgi:hypothetical protein
MHLYTVIGKPVPNSRKNVLLYANQGMQQTIKRQTLYITDKSVSIANSTDYSYSVSARLSYRLRSIAGRHVERAVHPLFSCPALRTCNTNHSFLSRVQNLSSCVVLLVTKNIFVCGLLLLL